MASSTNWSKAQAERLEESRAQELELREMWSKTEMAKKEEKEKTMEGKGWEWGSWWSGQWDWSTDKWGASGSQSIVPPPPPPAEPTAGSTAKSDTAPWSYPKRSVGEDHVALRNAAISPASFMPQRHVTMALGRPVVVFTGTRNAFGAFGVGCVVREEG
jgi:hypothetical protein